MARQFKPGQLQTGSLFNISSSYALTASNAQTVSYLNTLNQDLTFNGNLTLNGTASISYLNVAYETASVIYSSGSNQFGDAANDTQTLYGNVIVPTGSVGIGTTTPSSKLDVSGSARITDSLTVTGSLNVTGGITGSLLGTATTSSYVLNAVSSSFASTASFVRTAQTASYVLNAVSSSFASTASFVNPLTQTVTINGKLIQTGSHVQGDNGVASGLHSHAEGAGTSATGNYSHAEGASTNASQLGAHAEGQSTNASGNYSHAEGGATTANGSYSHAEGESTTATGQASHAEGFGTVAQGAYQHVQGQYNLSSSAQSAFIHGNGTGTGALRSNLIFASGSQVQVTGSLSVTGSSTIIGTQTLSGSLIFAQPTSPAFNGEIVRFGSGTLTTGQLYFLSSSGTWSLANANSTGSSTGMLGIATGTSPTTAGLLVRGYAASSSYTTATGSIVYADTSSGLMTTSSPTASNHVVRVVGYVTTIPNTIYFAPDPTFVTLA